MQLKDYSPQTPLKRNIDGEMEGEGFLPEGIYTFVLCDIGWSISSYLKNHNELETEHIH